MLNVSSFRPLARKVRAALVLRTKAILGAFYRPGRRRLDGTRKIIERSHLFDRNWYLQRYPDVAKAGTDPLDHFLTVGWREGRDPGPMFTTSAYLKANEDVAKSGVNPLLHFVEFGLAEGREGFGDRSPPPGPRWTSTGFDPPHECYSSPRSDPASVIWRRGHRLDRAHPLFVEVGDFGAGYATDEASRAAIQADVQWLRSLSGCFAGDLPHDGPSAGASGQKLVDAWYVNGGQLRTRWDGEELPLVVRAFQAGPVPGDQPRPVGEGVIVSQLDFIDLHLPNPYFPILFVFATPGGMIRGSEMLAFPSLCRGGMHYPELLFASAKASQASLDVAGVGRDLTRQFVALARGEAQAAVARILVDLAEADGNGPLFRSDFRAWLKQVVQIEIAADDRSGREDSREIVQSIPSQSRISRKGGATLALSADAAPTIASLVARREVANSQGSARPLPLLVSRIDPSEPAILIDVPAAAAPAVAGQAGGLPWLISAADGGAAIDCPPGAIRISSGSGPSDAQLLVPIAGPSLFVSLSRSPISWLVDHDEWDDSGLAQMLHTVALQRSALGDAVILIGTVTSAALASAGRPFPGDVKSFATYAEAVRGVETPLAGRIGAGVILHDSRTADCFASMLNNEAVTTASCVMVSAERRGGALKTAIVDAGTLLQVDGVAATPSESAAAVAELWRNSYPVARPSNHLWATRSSLLKSWADPARAEQTGNDVHLCASAVTATWLQQSKPATQNSDVPEAAATAMKVGRLFG